MSDEPKGPKNNVVDFSKASKGKGSGSGSDGSSSSGRNLYYAVQAVVALEEGERLIRLKYMTETGYLDILGIMNQVQLHNKRRFQIVGAIAAVGVVLSLTGVLLTVIALW
jgi:hypothetical protein